MEGMSTKQIAMRNGQRVMSALVHCGAIADDDLLTSFAQCTEQPIDEIEHELKRVLNNGVDGGFILKKGNKYEIPGLDSLYQTDADKGCVPEKKNSPASLDLTVGRGTVVHISISNPKGKRKADDEAEACPSTSRSSKKKKMYKDDDDGEDFHGFDSCKK